MDTTTCAEILWANTSGLGTGPGNEKLLSDARIALARIVRHDGAAGFLPPKRPTSEELSSKAWGECVEAAIQAETSTGTAPTYALLAAGSPASMPPTEPAKEHGLHWPYAPGTKLATIIGPLKSTTGQDVWLFLYSAIDTKEALEKDGDARSGFFPRMGARSGIGQGEMAPPTPQRSGAWAWVLFVASILLSAYVVTWVYAASEFTRGAVKEVLEKVTIEELEGGSPGYIIKKAGVEVGETTHPCLFQIQSRLGQPTVPIDPSACDEAWDVIWAAQNPNNDKNRNWWTTAKTWFWKGTDVGSQLSLLGPLLMSGLAIILMILAAGIALKSYFLGALIDERNRLSLSRVQQLAWTVVLLGGITILGVFNMSLLAGFVRDLAQMNTLQDAATEVQNFFPAMDLALWAALGINLLVSPLFSKLILNAKELKADSNQIQPIVASEALEKRAVPGKAALSDLFTSEGEANAGQVDVSRLQHLVITGLLLSGYVLLLVEYVRAIDVTSVLISALTGAPVFAAMPPIDGTFISLLVLSHAGYLAFKAMPSGTNVN